MLRGILGVLTGLVATIALVFITGYLTVHSRWIEQGLLLNFDLSPGTVSPATPAKLQILGIAVVAAVLVFCIATALVSRRAGIFAKSVATTTGIALLGTFVWSSAVFSQSFLGWANEHGFPMEHNPSENTIFILQEGSLHPIIPTVALIILTIFTLSVTRQSRIRSE